MASINDRREVGQEVVLRVQSSGKGTKVIEYDGVGLADGIMSKRTRIYKYGDNADEKATEYAYKKQEKLSEIRDCPVTVVELGEVMAEKLAEKHESDDAQRSLTDE